jgi:Skp family chaperone for outer membrane proteins
MEESIKSRVILILGILTIIFFIGTIGSCNSASRLKSSKNEEIIKRLDAEENKNKVEQEIQKLTLKLDNLAKELEDTKILLQTTNKALLQEQLISQSMKEELTKVTKLKDKLEEDLKELLMTEKEKTRK